MVSTRALLVMDVQQGIVDRYQSGPNALVPFQRAIAAARTNHIPVIFVRVAFRPGYPEVSVHNKRFSALAQQPAFTESSPSTQIAAGVGAEPGDIVVVKRRVSAFSGSDLAVVLRAAQCDELVLSGIATSGVVLSTLREAADRDYRLTVLSDACLDADPEVHRVLMAKVFPTQAAVLSVDAWAEELMAHA